MIKRLYCSGVFMDFFVYLSYYLIPLLIFYLVGFGLLMKVEVYNEFVKGAKEGLRVVADILPTLIGLMMGVGILRASGALDYVAAFLKPLAEWIHFPAELIPVTIIKMFSSSAATGLVLDLFETYGPDSLIGNTVSILCSCTETIFYTMSVYFLAAHVKKTRWTLGGCLLATLAGIVVSAVLGRMM